MPVLSPEQKSALLKQNGYDPLKFSLDDQTGDVYPRQTVGVAPQGIDQTQDQSSILGSGTRSFVANIAPSAIGLGAGALAANAYPALFSGGSSLAITVPATLLGMAVGGISSHFARKGQDALLPDSVKQQLALDAQQHPIATGVGGLASSLPFMRPNVAGLLYGNKQAIVNAGLGAGLGVAQDVASTKLQGGEIDPTSLALSALGGAALNSPTKLGQKLGIRPHVEAPVTGEPLMKTDEQIYDLLGQSKSIQPGDVKVSPADIFAAQDNQQGQERRTPAQLEIDKKVAAQKQAEFDAGANDEPMPSSYSAKTKVETKVPAVESGLVDEKGNPIQSSPESVKVTEGDYVRPEEDVIRAAKALFPDLLEKHVEVSDSPFGYKFRSAVDEAYIRERLDQELASHFENAIPKVEPERTDVRPSAPSGDRQPVVETNKQVAKTPDASAVPVSSLVPAYHLEHSTMAPTRAWLDTIRKKGGEVGQRVADSLASFYQKKDEYKAKYIVPIQNSVKHLSTSERANVFDVLNKEQRQQTSFRSELTSLKEQEAYDSIRKHLLAKQEDQIAAKQPVLEYNSDGIPIPREAKVDPFYFPQQIDPKVIELLTNKPNSNEAQALKREFIEHQLANQPTNGKSQAEQLTAAQQKLEGILKAYDSGETNQTRFNAVRKEQGIGIPESWQRKDLYKTLDSYFNRVATDRAFYDTVESKPDIARHIGMEVDAWGKELDKSIAPLQLRELKSVLEHIKGEAFDPVTAYPKTLNRLAVSLMLGPSTNFTNAASSVANAMHYLNPREFGVAFVKGITKFGDNYKTALENGYARKDMTPWFDFMNTHETALSRLNALANSFGKLNGRQLSDYVTQGISQGISDYIIRSKLLKANAGDKEAINIMRNADPAWQPGKVYSEKEIGQHASVLAGFIHGKHDPRTLPEWALKDHSLTPFMSLMNWNINQTNNFMRHVWTPAKNGNFTPMIMSLFGTAVGGYLIKEGREMLSGKKSIIPTLQEIVRSNDGKIDAHGVPLIAYNLASQMSITGFGGILSTIAKVPFDIAYKNIPQENLTFPLEEVAGNATKQVIQGAAAMFDDPDSIKSIGAQLTLDLLRENIQLARVATSQIAAHSNLLPETKKQIDQVNAKRDLRVFGQLNGDKVTEQTTRENNPYLGMKEKNFKKEEDLQKAAEMLPSLITKAIEDAKGDPAKLKQNLEGLKGAQYPTMPDPKHMPLSFVNYVTFLEKTQGKEAASKRLEDYLMHKVINKAKGEMVPH